MQRALTIWASWPAWRPDCTLHSMPLYVGLASSAHARGSAAGTNAAQPVPFYALGVVSCGHITIGLSLWSGLCVCSSAQAAGAVAGTYQAAKDTTAQVRGLPSAHACSHAYDQTHE